MKQVDVLETVEWGMKHFGSVATNRQLPLRDIRKTVDEGLVESVGMVEMCDGDGFRIEPSRCREGYKLTEAGIEKLLAYRFSLPSPAKKGGKRK